MDITEIAQIRIYIQRQSMHCHKMTASHSYCTNFPFLRSSRGQPYSGRSLHSPGLNAIRCADPDHRFFQHMNIFLQPQMIILQIQDRITNQLSGTMISNIPSSINMIKGGTNHLQLCLSQQHIRFLSTLA